MSIVRVLHVHYTTNELDPMKWSILLPRCDKKMTITRAKGEGNGHFYHIEVIDLPFHTIPFVSCFISLIENTKK